MKPEPNNKFEQWVIDEISYIHNTLNNHLRHHTMWAYGLVISLVGSIGALVVMIFRYMIAGG